jgi:hypothetical protein
VTSGPEKEVIVVRDSRVERLFLGPGSVRYEGWSSLRTYFNEARSALAMEILGGKAPALGALAAECSVLLQRKDRINAPTRDVRRLLPRRAPLDMPPKLQLGIRRQALDGELHNFAQGAKTPHFTPVPFHVWRPAGVWGLLGRYDTRQSGHVLPQAWFGEFKGKILYARRAEAAGNVFVIRRRGNQALVADSSSRLWVGTLKAHHRKMHFTMEDEGLWDSLLVD